MSAIKTTTYSPSFLRFLGHIDRRKYTILLISFLILVFGNTFTPDRHIFGTVNIYQNLLTGFFVFHNEKRLRFMILGIIIISLGLDLFNVGLTYTQVRNWHIVLYLLFFSGVVAEVFITVLYVKTVSIELLSAALCGFVLLCQIGTFLFYLTDINSPHSFSNTGEGSDTLINLNYFSFTTLLTIGFGDITPLSLIAKRSVMFIGLLGHFYTVFVTSIIIGKYLSTNKS